MMMSWKRHSRARVLASVPLALFAVLTLAINPASATPRSLPTPAISVWKASPTTLRDAGGTVTFTGVFKYAATCELSVSPAIKGQGLPFTSTCSSNRYSKKVAIPANATGTPKDYTFAFAVRNKTGKTPAANIVVAVGAAPPPISFTPSSVSFSPQGVGVTSTPINIQVTNNSANTTQDLSSFSMIGADTSDFYFATGNCNVALSPHQTCDMSITFKPQSGGIRSAIEEVYDASWGSGTTASLRLSGNGEFGTASVSTTDLVFPSEGVYVPTNYQPITVTNSGSVPLVVDGLSIEGGDFADFSLLGNTCSGPGGTVVISTGDNCTFLVQFDPTVSGARTSDVVLNDNTAAGVTDITLKGTGAWASSTLSTYAVTFPATTVNTTSVFDILITNTGTVGLRFDISPAYSFTGNNTSDFSYSPDITFDDTLVHCSDQAEIIDPGQNCEFQVSFTPLTAAGPLTATFDLYDNSNNASTSTPGYEQVTLTGTGLLPT